MKPILQILHRVLVVEFYKTNASFFLLVIGFAVGFMRGPDHIALGESFIGSPILLSIPVLIWIAYAAKAFLFNQAILQRKETEFLFQFNLLDPGRQLLALLVSTFNQLVPVYVYAAFLMALALKHHLLTSFILIVFALLCIQWATMVLMKRSLNHPNQEKHIGFFKRIVDKFLTKPYPLFALEWIVRRKFILMIGFKFFSCLLLYGVFQLYHGEEYDARLLGMTVATAMGCHMSLIYELHRFENLHFSMLRQLPIGRFTRVSYTSAAILILILPETGMMISMFPSHLTIMNCMSVILLAWSITVLLYASLYQKDRDEEQVVPYVFGAVMLYMVLILFRVPMLLLAGINFGIAYGMIRLYYFEFEPVSKS
jgi:hypothetical protein